ncbi:hypothetical protein EDB19DRAFT_1830925 [Suillus lakei]|nr:hypothetical protein EDB19DRAFT_1830925 [Suillus lakei]
MSTIAVVSAGAMGSAIAKRLVHAGCTVYTNLDGRPSSAHQRALDAGMINVPLETLVSKSQWILSIVPPGEAFALHRRSAESLRCPIPPLPFHALSSITSLLNLGEYNEDFFNLMPVLFPYNRFTMTDELLQQLAGLTKEGFSKAQEEWEESVVAWERRKAKAKNESEAGAALASTPSASADAAHLDDGAGGGVDGGVDGDASRADSDGDTTRGDNAQ